MSTKEKAMKVRVVKLIEDETSVLVYAGDVSDEQIIRSVCDEFLEGLEGLKNHGTNREIFKKEQLEDYPKTVEDFNDIGTFEMEIEDQTALTVNTAKTITELKQPKAVSQNVRSVNAWRQMIEEKSPEQVAEMILSDLLGYRKNNQGRSSDVNQVANLVAALKIAL